MLKRQFAAFLFTSILMVILGHSMIPHHHHFDSILSHRNCQQQDKGKHDTHPGDPKSHCHAFNGMDYYPTPEAPSTCKPQRTATALFLNHVWQTGQSLSNGKTDHPKGDILILPARFPNPSYGLRAPPAIA